MDGLRLASAGDDVKLWDCPGGFSLLHAFNPHRNRNIGSLSWNFDGSLLASCSPEDEQVVLTYTKNTALTFIELQCGAGVRCTDFSAKSSHLLCGGAEGVSLWDLKTKTLKKSFQEHKHPVTVARSNWNSSYIASGSESGQIVLHSTLTGQSSSPLTAPGLQAIRQLEYSIFKKSIFSTASDDGSITLWDSNTRRLLHSFKDAHVAPATGLAFSPINEMLMMSVGLDQRVVCYDIQKKHVLKAIDAQNPLTCMDIMPDGATVAVGSSSGKIYVYDLRQGGNMPVHVFQAHKTSVRSIKAMPIAKSQNEDAVGVKAGVTSTSGSRRQLPSAPLVMQDITPSKTGQTTDTRAVSQTGTSRQTAEIFSPAAAGNVSQHSSSALQLSLNHTQENDSCSAAGLFSPVNKDLSQISQISNFSMHSFLGRDHNNVSQSPLAAGVVQANSSSNASCSVKPSESSSAFQHSDGSIQASAVDSSHHLHHHTSNHQGHDLSFPPVASSASLSHLHLSHPQLSSSLQSSLTDPHQANKAAGQHGTGLQVVGGGEGWLNGQGDGGLTLDGLNRSKASASPDSAAISGDGDDRELEEERIPSSGAVVPINVGASSEVGATQREFLKSLVEDAMEDLRDDLHRDIQGLHLSMLRQFHNFERETQSTLSHYLDMNQKLMMQVRQLEEENRRLKKNY